MMRLSLLVATITLAIAGAWFSLDRVGGDQLRRELEGLHLDELVDFRDLTVELPARVRIEGASLRDPSSGQQVAWLDELIIELETAWLETEPPRVVALRGGHGRVLYHSSPDLDAPLISALVALVGRIIEALPPSVPASPPAPLPPMLFEDVELLIHADGWPVERFEDSSVSITQRTEGVVAEIHAGRESGTLTLVFGSQGLTGLTTRQLEVCPALTTSVPTMGNELADLLTPRGRLDVDVSIVDGEAAVQGHLREAHLDAEAIPFDLQRATIPFVYQEGRVRVDDARIGFDGGEVALSLDGTLGQHVITLDVAHAEFREHFLRLIPNFEDLGVIECSDGGSYEAHLELTFDESAEEPAVQGEGGFLVEALTIQPQGIAMHDVVGRFVVDGGIVEFQDVSAMVAQGQARGHGSLDYRDETYTLDIALEDAAAAEAYPWIASAEARLEPSRVSGWVQGSVSLAGTVGDAASVNGEGQVSVRAAELWETPLLEAILMASGSETGPSERHRIAVAATLERGQVFVDDFRVQTDVFNIRGTGVADMSGNLNLELWLAEIPLWLVGDLLDFIVQELVVRLEVRGTLEDPEVIVVPPLAGPIRRVVDFVRGDQLETSPR